MASSFVTSSISSSMSSSIIKSHVKMASVRRKRSRHEFDTENIDVMAIGINGSGQPRKKQRHSLNQIKSNTLDATKKRCYSQTEFSTNYGDDRVLKECSPNKKIKINHYQQTDDDDNRMMIDNQSDHEMDHGEKPMIKMDDEGDVSMGSVSKSCVINVAGSNHPNGSNRKKRKTKFPPNRVRRSGLEFCVECGIGA